MRIQNKTLLYDKLKESLVSVLPIAGIVFLLCFSITPIPNDIFMAFVLGTLMLIVGMGFFTLGTDLAMTPIGEQIGSTIIKTKKIWIILGICFLVGTIITISEPDLQVLAEQVPNIPNMIIILSVSVGVGIFLVVALLRIFFRIKLSYLLIGLYTAIAIMTQFIPTEFQAVAFDAGGVTTGPMTVPFIMALGVGVASMRMDKDAENDSFGLVALCSVGPIVAVMMIGLLYSPGESVYSHVEIPTLSSSRELWLLFEREFPVSMADVGAALFPIVIFFAIFQCMKLRLKNAAVVRIGIGIFYTYIGLVLFLTGANVGFMPVGNYIGRQLGAMDENWIIVPIGMLIGYFIVAAEPAVHVLNKQVYEMSSGLIPKKAMSTSLSIGVAISVGLAMLRIIVGIPVLFILLPGYAISLILSFFVPPIFTAIAFDSGGVASGPMTATFLLPLAMGACVACGGNVITDAFGVVAMVAMTPLITIQILGVLFKRKMKMIHTDLYSESETSSVKAEKKIE